jgi:retron-type reverse transcriptase
MLLEEKLESIFHQDSYGCRPGRSAYDAIGRDSKALLEAGLGVGP